jgi:hypothetical protein
MINFNTLRTDLNALRQERELPKSFDALIQKTDEKTQEAFLAFSRDYPSAFGNPSTPIQSFEEGVKRFLVAAKDYHVEKWNKENSALKKIIKKIDFFAAKMNFWMLLAVTKGDAGSDLASTKIDGMSFVEGYPAFLSHLKENNNLEGKIALHKREIMTLTLKNKGKFAFPAGLEQFSPNLFDIQLPKLWIKVLSSTISQFTNLRHLNLCDNCIENVPDEIGQLQELKTLDLSKNCIKRLPTTITGCTALEKLNVSTNPLNVTHEVLKALTTLNNLKKVDLRSTEGDLSEEVLLVALDQKGVKVKFGEIESDNVPQLPGLAGLPGLRQPGLGLQELFARDPLGLFRRGPKSAEDLPSIDELLEILKK